MISSDIEELILHLKQLISAHPIAKLVSDFDHVEHTTNLAEGKIEADLINGRVISFCIGKNLYDPLLLAVRPRSIGIAEQKDQFIFSFMDAPNPDLNKTMEGWIKSMVISSEK